MEPLLFLCHRIPYPPDKGDKIRAWHILEHLSRTHEIHLGCFVDDPADMVHAAALREVCRGSVMLVPQHPRKRLVMGALRLRQGVPLSVACYAENSMQKWVDETLALGVRKVFAYSGAMAQFVMDRDVDGIMDLVDVDSEKWREYAYNSSWPANWIWKREATTLLAWEKRVVAHFRRTLFVSAPEAARFCTLSPLQSDRIGYIENGVDTARFSPELSLPSPYRPNETPIVFTGTMNYRPNVEAMVWFVRRVLPLVLSKRPSARLHIVGADPSSDVRKLERNPAVSVTGRVADTRPYMSHARVAVAPLLIARGIQNKVLEAMATGCPVVASTPAFEGIRAMPGTDLLVADTPQAMSQAIVSVLDGEHPYLGGCGRDLVCREYGWDKTLAPLAALLPAISCTTVLS